ncbi:MAG: hypothetical protein R3F14_37960 [Polyangiaceae bacterium]
MKHVLIDSPVLYGVFASAGATLTLDHVDIESPLGPGIWTTCGQESCCDPGAPRPSVTILNTIITGAHLAGASFVGSDVTIDGLTISGTAPGPQGTSYSGQGGGGFTASSCADIAQAKDLHILDSARHGALFDASTGTLGDEAGQPITIEGSGAVGFWAQTPPKGDPTQPWITLENAFLLDNKGVGLGASGGNDPLAERGMIICKVLVTGVPQITLPTLKDGFPGSDSVGDGFFWRDAAAITELDITVSGAERQAVLINGAVPQPPAGALAITLGSGNASNTVLQQGVPAGQELTGVPALQTTPTEDLAGAQNLALPAIVTP